MQYTQVKLINNSSTNDLRRIGQMTDYSLSFEAKSPIVAEIAVLGYFECYVARVRNKAYIQVITSIFLPVFSCCTLLSQKCQM